MMLSAENAAKFDAIAECHRDGLVSAAHDAVDVVWLNLCNLYGFSREARGPLRTYVCEKYPRIPGGWASHDPKR